MQTFLSSKFLMLLILLYLPSNSQSTTTVVWSDTFTYGVSTTQCQCDRWIEFWTYWIGNPTLVQLISLESSNGPGLNYTCSGSNAALIAQKMYLQRLGREIFVCTNDLWYLNNQSNSRVTVHMQIGGDTVFCNTYPSLRPCMYGSTWGNIGNVITDNCGGPSQTFKVTVVTSGPAVVIPKPNPICDGTVPNAVVSGGFFTRCLYTVTCLSNYYTADTKMQIGNYTCAGPSNWIPNTPSCLPSCPAPIVASGIFTNYSLSMLPTKRYPKGTVAQLYCVNPTNYLIGSPNSTCLLNMTWFPDPSSPICKASCAAPIDVNGVFKNYSLSMLPTNRYLEGTVAHLYCADLTKLLVGNPNSICQGNSSWSQITALCIAFCQPNPCRNGGKCELSDKTNFTCACVKQWEGQICDKFGWPKDPLGIVALVSQTIGCTTVVVLLSITVVAYLVARDFSPQPLMILLSDFSALTAHIFVLFCRYPFLANLTVIQCKFVAFIVQFSFLASWNFLLLQTCQAFAIVSGVITKGHWPFTRAWQVVLYGFGLPVFVTTVSFSVYFDDFVTPFTCLVNYGNASNRIIIFAALAIGSLIIIFAESVGIIEESQLNAHHKRAKLLLAVDRTQYVSGRFGLKSSVIVFSLSIATFLLVSSAVYNVDSYLFSAAFFTNIVSGISTFVFHCVEHPKVWAIVVHWAKLIFPCCWRKKWRKHKAIRMDWMGQTDIESFKTRPEIPEKSSFPPRF